MASSILPMNLRATNLALSWKNWKTQFAIFMRASGFEHQTNQRKVALMLHHLGVECLDIFYSFDCDVDNISYDELIGKFNKYFLPKVNIAVERHKFFTCKQKDEQTIDEYVTCLKNLSLTCEFDSLVKDIFVCGLSSNLNHIKERLLSEGDIKMEKAIEIAKNIEVARINAAELQGVNDNAASNEYVYQCHKEVSW